MKAILYGACAALLLASGCAFVPAKPHADARRDATAPLPRYAPMVSPDQVNENNARQKMRALEEELNHARTDLPAERESK